MVWRNRYWKEVPTVCLVVRHTHRSSVEFTFQTERSLGRRWRKSNSIVKSISQYAVFIVINRFHVQKNGPNIAVGIQINVLNWVLVDIHSRFFRIPSPSRELKHTVHSSRQPTDKKGKLIEKLPIAVLKIYDVSMQNRRP